MKQKRLTQKDMVLKFMIENGYITSLQAIYQFGATRLADIIFKLRNEGYEINSQYLTKKGRYGNTVTFCKYTLVEEKENDSIKK